LFFSFQYHGETNFGWTISCPFIATSYDYDAPLNEYGMHKKKTNSALLLLLLLLIFMQQTLVGLKSM